MHLNRHVLSGVLLLCGVALPSSTQAEQAIFFVAWMQGNPGSPTAYRSDVCYVIDTVTAHCLLTIDGNTFSGEMSVDSDFYFQPNGFRRYWSRGYPSSNGAWVSKNPTEAAPVPYRRPGLGHGATEWNDVAYTLASSEPVFATDVGIYRDLTRIREGVYTSVAVDNTRGVIYAIAPGNIVKLDLDGNLIELLHLDVVEPPLGLAIDEDANKIWWHTEDKIKRANTSGYNSGLVTIHGELGGTIADIEVFPESNSVYSLWDAGSEWAVYRMGRGGNNLELRIIDYKPAGYRPVGFDVHEPGCRLGDGSQRLFGDVTVGWNSVDFRDIQKVAQCFQGLGSSSDRERCDLSPCLLRSGSCLGDDDISYFDINNVIDAFQGLGCR